MANKLELTWYGKDEPIRVEPRLLIENTALSNTAADPDTQNMLIHGDNLLALKALESKFAGQVKCIYIDPPYNANAANIYDDNIEHSLWLNLIRPRLQIMWSLLDDTGSIWISIDDNERDYLKVLCDELFGRSCFLASIVWQKRYSRENREAIGDSHEYILVYVKDKDAFKKTRNYLPLTEKLLTTAEDIVAVVDAVIAKGSEAAKDFIAEFTGIATDDQVLKALQMACELQLIVFDSSRGCYGSPSFLARKLVSASSDEQKAVFMRLILEQYAPYNTFKTRYGFTKSIELACRQTKTLHMMTSNERDVKNTLISIATYAKALKSEGANLYSFVEDVDAVGIIEAALRSANITENSLRTYWGENLYTFVNTSNVFAPLVEALQKTHSGTMDVRSIVVCAANAFESFLADFAVRKGVSLSGRNGILQKRDALSAHISKKHRGMIEFVGQVRNAADHGADPDENNQVWTISNETARIYPCIIAALIKAIFSRDATGSIEV